MSYSTIGAPATVLAECVRADSTTFPWAVRSGNLTYIGEIPFAYMTEGDRYLILCDLLFDALAPMTATQHRALVRLEDIHPLYDPTALVQTAEWLFSKGIPFSFHITAAILTPRLLQRRSPAGCSATYTAPYDRRHPYDAAVGRRDDPSRLYPSVLEHSEPVHCCDRR